MDVIKLPCAFEFNDDTVFDKEIGDELPNDDAVIPDFHRLLLQNLDPSPPQFVGKGPFVDFFQES